ncbi:MAG: hypothetical protein ACLFMX_05670 [Halobacteriales archaeon]
MGRSLLEVVRSLPRRNRDEDGQDVPSLLDRSVRTSHADPDAEIDRELDRIEEQADALEEHHEPD